jgi:pyrroline-5-carboxylate reductase
MATYFTFAEEIAAWLTRHGVPAADARRYVGTVFQGLGNIAATTQEPASLRWRASSRRAAASTSRWWR